MREEVSETGVGPAGAVCCVCLPTGAQVCRIQAR